MVYLPLEVWTGIAYWGHEGDFGGLFFPLSKCVYFSCAVSTHTDRQVDQYWSPPGSLLITGWITTGHRLDHYWSPAGSLLVGGCDLYYLAYRSLLVLLVFSTFEYSLYAFIRVDLRAEYITHPYY